MTASTTILIIVSTASLIGIAVWMRFKWFLYTDGKQRDIPVTPFRFFSSFYSLLFFIVMVYGVALPFTIVLYLTVWKKSSRLYAYHVFLRWSSQLILRILPGIDYTYNNAVGEKFTQPGVIISNHQGHFDLMCIMMMTPRLVVLTNRWVWRNPLYGWIIRFAEFYPVTNGLDYNIPRLKSLIERGYSVVIFPEGTRSANCHILRFHTGAFYLASKLGVDILPVILHGVGHCIPKEDFMLRHGHMYLEVMNRVKIEPDGSEMYMRTLSKRVRAQYIKRYNELKRERETASYYAGYVINKFKYTGIGSCRHVRKLLKQNNNYSSTADYGFESGSTILIHDKSQGALSWLISLIHDDVTVISVIDDSIALQRALKTPNPEPQHIQFTDNYCGYADYVITMLGNGSVNSIEKIIK